ncbi:helix-turn-helix domain-containing protein [Streptomyces rhizosphaericus]|uniref:Helix-turn-helix domain-containing protein n=1 Tax=Streptomyces rhizosphaericus TaxID=114699 RepID=A0A6G4ANS0_9ACTN|nr:helix-turn-helix domain-containing protein [Streptomyces rhizosphaericus]NEW74985.1 helix-turn-helix domain-containing protein [Streptomyces rhizosphaericus]
MAITKKDVEAAIAQYDRTIEQANLERAQFIARAADDMPQKDIIEATGYSRETVRRLTREGQEALARTATEPADPGSST